MHYLVTHKGSFPGQLAVSNCKHLVPHPKMYEAMVLLRGTFIGPHNALTLCNHMIKQVTHAWLLDVTIDNKLTRAQHISEVK